MAKLTGAPFVKVEATKYTEVGFKGSGMHPLAFFFYSILSFLSPIYQDGPFRSHSQTWSK
jgi:hypothetical protein